VKVIANVSTNLWTLAPQESRETSRGRPGGCCDMRAEACILEQSLLEMALNCVCKCELVEAREAGPCSKSISMQGTLNATSAPTLSSKLQCFSSVFYSPSNALPPFIQIACRTKFLKRSIKFRPGQAGFNFPSYNLENMVSFWALTSNSCVQVLRGCVCRYQ